MIPKLRPVSHGTAATFKQIGEAKSQNQGAVTLRKSSALVQPQRWYVLRSKFSYRREEGGGWRFWLFWLVLTGVFTLALAGLALGFFWYQKTQPARLTRAAHRFAGIGEFGGAMLSVRRALEFDRNYLPACQMMAALCERLGDPLAISWRQQVAERSSYSEDSVVAWAASAVRFHRLAAAREALGHVSNSAKKRHDIHAIAGAAALADGRMAEAEGYYAEAVRLAPENAEYRFCLAKAQMASEDFFTRQSGRAEIARMRDDPAFGAPGLRALIGSYQAHGELAAARAESSRLVVLPTHVFSDELVHLRLLQKMDDPQFGLALGELEERAARKPADAGALLVALSDMGLASEALDWATIRNPEVGSMPEVRPAITACCLALHKWSDLLQFTEGRDWKTFDYARFAYRTRAMREQGNIFLARSEWTLATGAARGNPQALAWLARTAATWLWADQAKEALWMALETTKDSRPALEKLYRSYVAEKDAEGLRLIAAYEVKLDPGNDNALNDFAMLSLLLNKNAERAVRMAAELYGRRPKHPAYASTHAFALYCAGRPAEAVQILEAFPLADLEEPQMAAYYGIFLAAAGESEKAKGFLEKAGGATLLPEEQRLVANAARSIPSVIENELQSVGPETNLDRP